MVPRCRKQIDDLRVNIHFSDWFELPPKLLEDHGALNISLINDLPLFIDPFLLFEKYPRLHDQIIAYLQFLRDQSVRGNVSEGLLKAWYMFPEVRQLWLGFCLTGNEGRGLGPDFAVSLNENLHDIFKNFGKEKVTKGSHLEKVCLINPGVGRDNISDFTSNLIKNYLLDFTEKFAKRHIKEALHCKCSVPKAYFDYERQVWLPKEYDLPYINGDYVILTPRDILTRDDSWINRSEMIDNIERIAESVSNDQLRAEINQYLDNRLFIKKQKDLTKEEKQKVYVDTLKKFPQLIEYYIRSKEDRGQQAIVQSQKKISESESFYVFQVAQFASQLLSATQFYSLGIDTFEEARLRIQFLKHEIENNDGYRLFYHDGKAIERESDLQILYRLTWFATPSDFNSEVNNGRGPVDFKVSRGSKDKTLVEFKLAKNTQLKKNLQNQLKIYEKANRTSKSLKVIFYFTIEEKNRVDLILQELNLQNDNTIVLVDARLDNKISASKAS